MALALLPFEEDGPLLTRWWRNSLRPFKSLRSIWIEAYRGHSLLAPLGFAYLWILAACPLLFAMGKLGMRALKARMGPYAAMSLANTIQVAPGTLASFLLGPLLIMFAGGCVAHGLLWLMDSGVRGQLRGTLRVFGYGHSWMLPFASLFTASLLYLQTNPMAAVQEGAGLGMGLITAPSPMLLVLTVARVTVGLATLMLVIWGLASLHRIALWKAIPAALIAFGVVWVSDQVLVLLANRGAVSGLLWAQERRQREESTPTASIRRLISLVERIQEEAQGGFRKAGLPAPPRAVDLLTGGDWGAAIDLKQASEDGFVPSCQVVYLQTLSALKGQVLHYSACLGEGTQVVFNREPAALLPPGSEAAARMINQSLNADQRAALTRARSAFSEAILVIESEIGPFETTPMRSLSIVPEPSAAVAPTPVMPPRPPDPNVSSRHQFTQLPLAEVRRLAAEGHPAAMNQLGTLLYFGKNEIGKEIIAVRKAEGVPWLIRAYKAGFRDAGSCAVLMVAFSQGEGVPVDPTASSLWSKRSEAIWAADRAEESQAAGQ